MRLKARFHVDTWGIYWVRISEVGMECSLRARTPQSTPPPPCRVGAGVPGALRVNMGRWGGIARAGTLEPVAGSVARGERWHGYADRR